MAPCVPRHRRGHRRGRDDGRGHRLRLRGRRLPADVVEPDGARRARRWSRCCASRPRKGARARQARRRARPTRCPAGSRWSRRPTTCPRGSTWSSSPSRSGSSSSTRCSRGCSARRPRCSPPTPARCRSTRSPRGCAARDVPRHALLQPGLVAAAGRARPRRRDRATPRCGPRGARRAARQGARSSSATCPGFATSRLDVVAALEAMRMLESGVASAEDIDTRHGGRLPPPDGPAAAVRRRRPRRPARHRPQPVPGYGERFAPPQILVDKVAAGQLGRKTGQGFFPW